jgi:hypothetical protein
LSAANYILQIKQLAGDKKMMKRAGMVFAFVTMAAAFGAVHAQDKVLKLAPDQTFQFKENAYGCLSRDNLSVIDEHATVREKQRTEALFNGFQCLSTPQNSDFRVIRVIGHDVEFQNSGNQDTRGLWTSDRFIKQ